MAKLDDLFTASMKQPRKLLDLSKVKIFNDADFFKYMDRVPDMKLRPEEVDPEDIELVTDFSFTTSKQDIIQSGNGSKSCKNKYFYEDPLPLSMRSTRLEDFWVLDIHWKMLTSDRPPNKLEESIFERLVDLGRFALSARKQEQATIKAIMSSIIGTPAVTYLVAIGFITSRSKRGAMETKLKCCKNCALELCDPKLCKLFHYEAFTRMIMDKEELEDEDKEEMAFLKSVSKSANTGPANAAAKTTAAKKKAKQQGASKKLKMRIKKTKKKKKKKKNTTENLEPVLAPDD